MQRRELDRDAGASIDAAPVRHPADGVDRSLILAIVEIGVSGRHGRFAQHVIGIAEASRFQRTGSLQRLVDRLTHDELLAHHAHRHIDAVPDHRLAATRDQPRQRRGEAVAIRRRGQPAGDDEPPGRGIDEQRASAIEMRCPVAFRDLVADQRVARRRIGNTQQRLGKAHQRNALLTGERILLNQRFDARTFVLGAQRLDQPACRARDVLLRVLWKCRRSNQRRQAFRLWTAIGRGDGLTQCALRPDRRREFRKRPSGRPL